VSKENHVTITVDAPQQHAVRRVMQQLKSLLEEGYEATVIIDQELGTLEQTDDSTSIRDWEQMSIKNTIWHLTKKEEPEEKLPGMAVHYFESFGN
jgi:hypothetical protein